MPSFPPATILPVERLELPPSLLLDGSNYHDIDNKCAATNTTREKVCRTSSLHIGKRILSFVDDNGTRVWLHRKVRSTPTDGTIRLGYLLQPSENDNCGDDDDKEIVTWTVATEVDTVQMVEVRIEEKATEGVEEEFAALQWVTQHSCSPAGLHVTQVLLGVDAKHLYCLQPHEPSCMSLAAYLSCNSSSREQLMQEQETRRFFRNIVTGLETMKSLGIFHGCINNETLVVVKNKSEASVGVYDCHISELGCCRQIEHSSVTDVRSSLHQMPQFVPPEVWNGSTVELGSDLDLWAAGVVLYMLTSAEPFFAAPVPSDPMYAKTFLQPASEGAETSMDLVQSMLCYDRKERLTLQQIRDHPWLRTPS